MTIDGIKVRSRSARVFRSIDDNWTVTVETVADEDCPRMVNQQYRQKEYIVASTAMEDQARKVCDYLNSISRTASLHSAHLPLMMETMKL